MKERATVARPYAKALFELATQKKKQQEWGQWLAELSIVLVNMTVLLKEHSLSLDDFSELFLKTVCAKVSDPLFKNFLAVIVEKKRLGVLPEMAVLYERMWLASQDRIKVRFFSPKALVKKQQQYYQKILEDYFSKSAEMLYETDEKLIGGFLANIGDDVVDGSVPGFLQKLKKVMGG